MRRADHLSRGALPSVVCLSVIVKPSIIRRPWHTRGCCAMERKYWVKSTDNETVLYIFTHPSALPPSQIQMFSPTAACKHPYCKLCCALVRHYCHIHMLQERTYNFGALLVTVKSTNTCQPIILDLHRAALKIRQKSVTNS